MTDAATLEAIRRVEQTPLGELVNVSVEDVTTQMDALLNPELDSSSFYHRWETQQWAVADLDFSADKAQWANIPPAVQKTLRTTLTLFFFHRFFPGGPAPEGAIHSAMLEFRPKTRAGYRRIFDVDLVDAIDACR